MILLIIIILSIAYTVATVKAVEGERETGKKIVITFLKSFLTIILSLISFWGGIIGVMILESMGIHILIGVMTAFVLPLFLPLIWIKIRKKYFICWCVYTVIALFSLGMNYEMEKYDESITVNVTPNSDIADYLPFKEESKIVKRKSIALK